MAGRFPILYIAEAGAEDAVMSSGVLAYLVEAMPQASFTVVGSPQSAPLFADTPRLDKLIVLEKEGRLDWLGLWNQVRAIKWGLVVDMRGTTFSGKLSRQKRAVRGKDEPGVHKVELAARVLQLDEVPPPKLFVSDATRASVDALLPQDDAPLLVIAPGAAWVGREWPSERYATLASTLTNDGPLAGGRVVVLGEEKDKDAGHTIRLAMPRHRTTELPGRLTPLQALAVLERAKLYLGGDSLWTQLAVAAGAPVVAAYGPSDETVRGPWGGVVVRGPRSVDEFRKIDPALNQAILHMNEVPADRVLKAAKKLLVGRAG
ncbi:glycosyltransferase family 9 protein [Brevundimonas sp. FT23028]|uniref:glycosyltransferase family 9 protein n=1 Tax=Brevundimonas sp. FT23028 TaxID=3393748 RepID=UPI003B58AB03